MIHMPTVMSAQVPFSLMQVINFTTYSKQLSSSGLPTADDLTAVKQQKFQHVINLIPGDMSKEAKQVKSLNMSFEQIAVDWQKPTLANFNTFVKLMNQYGDDKIYVHCQMNYRASTFIYLYQVTQQGVAPDLAYQKMLSVWKPHPTWLTFAEEVLGHYNKSKKRIKKRA
jgi:protein tyrosine phosphatase (PTP) superfamily phosphohydrolase (DUF442 family)